MYKSTVLTLLCSTLAFFLSAQQSVPFDTIHWNIQAQEYELTKYKGQDALYIKGGIAMLKDASLEDGIIEWDMAFPAERGFTGIRFRAENPQNCEEFYFRPHQSGNPDANQYTPVNNGLAGWQLYHGPEYSVPYEYNFEKWFHVKLVVSGTRAELYIDNMRAPVLHIPALKRTPKSGGMMLYGSMVPTYFANFSYQAVDNPELINDPIAPAARDANIIGNWQVSNPFPEEQLKDQTNLDNISPNALNWTALETENTGTANIASVAEFQRETKNTVFAKLVVESSIAQIKGLQLGFSDRVRVFCNGQLMFAGNDAFRTRDYRYLGTIGYFDTVYLPLQNGRNEIWIAVSENFGGWGLRGRWEEMMGIKIVK